MKHMRHIAKEVDDWTRVEAQFSGKYAHQLTEAIKNCQTDEQLKNIIISSILDRYMFFYVSSNRPHKLTRLMLELLDEKDFHFESLQKKIDEYAETHSRKTTHEVLLKIKTALRDAYARGYIANDFAPLVKTRGVNPPKRNRALSITDFKKLRNYVLKHRED